MAADKKVYLEELAGKLQKVWPDNESVTVVCHGHSIPCGYMADNVTRPFDAYPHLFHVGLAERFPHCVVNVIVTAVGGENSVSGVRRFERDVLCHRPYLVTIDYGRNDMFLTGAQMRGAWREMTEQALDAGCKVLLLTPAPDSGAVYYEENARLLTDGEMAEIIRETAEQFHVGLADVHETFEGLFARGHRRSEYAASVNHPGRRGHEIIADCMLEWVPYI